MTLGEMEELVVVDADLGCVGAELWCVGCVLKGTAARVEDNGTGILGLLFGSGRSLAK